MDLSLNKDEKRALTVTIVVHALLIILFCIFGLKYMVPPPPEAGILINFGTSDQGSGDRQTQSPTETNPQPVEDVSQEAVSTPVEAEQVVTQNTEVAPQLKTQEKDQIREPEKEPEEPKPSTKLSNALKNWDKTKDSSSSDGITGKPGDQGDVSGSPKSNSYVGGPGGGGFEFSLGNRKVTRKPDIRDNSQEEGKVVVEIIVDRYGNVVRASPGARGSTTASGVLNKIAKDAAMSTKFTANPNGPEEQKGTITFSFIVKG